VIVAVTVGADARTHVAVVEQLELQLTRSPEVTVRYPFAPDLVDCAGAE